MSLPFPFEGANVIVAGSAIFGASNPEEVIKQLRAAVDEAIAKRAAINASAST